MFGTSHKGALEACVEVADADALKANLEAKSLEVDRLNAAAADKALQYAPEVELIDAPAGRFWKIQGSPSLLIKPEFIVSITLSRDGGPYRYRNFGFDILVIEGGMSTIQISMVSGIEHTISIETTCADSLLTYLRKEWMNGRPSAQNNMTFAG